jgi:hypothetical protein
VRAFAGGSVVSSRLFSGTLTTVVMTSVATYRASAAAVQPMPSFRGALRC